MNDNSAFRGNPAYTFYMSERHDCSYLSGQTARSLFLDPHAQVDNTLYQLLIDRGFRRSGPYLYQPACPACDACISLRIPTRAFKPNRSQRRNWQANHGRFEVSAKAAEFEPEHYALYQKYQQQRHSDGAMVCNTPEQYMNFLCCDWAQTLFYEFRLQGDLAAVAVTDLLPEGLSAVYTFFDPERIRDGLGVYALLWQLHHSRKLDKPWVYPGFWIAESEKMRYKASYRPLEAWTGHNWRRFHSSEEMAF
jgi:arginine-tRNA-protein transferase